jgi:hypothetical protein
MSDPNYHVDIPAPIKAMITRFETSHRDYSFIGMAMVEDHEAIEEEYKWARRNLEQTIKTYLDREAETHRRHDTKFDKLERQVKAADALAEAVDDFGNLKPTDSSVVWGLRLSRCLSELAAYTAAKEGGA